MLLRMLRNFLTYIPLQIMLNNDRKYSLCLKKLSVILDQDNKSLITILDEAIEVCDEFRGPPSPTSPCIAKPAK